MEQKKNIIKRIEGRLATMTDAQLKIANCILLDPTILLFSSIEQAAGQTGVSTATIVRFANLFGLHGYTELQGALRAYHQEQLEPVGRLHTSMDGLDPSENAFRRIYIQQLKSLETLYTPELEEKLERAVALLSAAGHIYTAGPRGSFAIAYYLGHHFNRIFCNCDILEDNERLSDGIFRIKPNDVMLIINQPRYTKRMFQAAQLAKSGGAKLITVSDSVLSPYSRISDVFFAAPNQSGDFHNSLLSTMMIAEILITSMMSLNKQLTQDSLNRIEPLFKHLETFSTH